MSKRLKTPSFRVNFHEGTPFFRKAVEVPELEFDYGRIYGVFGQTGSGKSSFCRAITASCAGRVELLQETDFKPTGVYIFQQPEHQFFASTCREELLFGLRSSASESQKNFTFDRELRSVLEKVGMDTTILDSNPRHLSGGQKRRLAIASILLLKPDLIVLDEPTAGLDPVSKYKILELIQELRSEGVLVFWVSHDLTDLVLYSDECLSFHEGGLLGRGNPVEMLRESPLELEGLCEKLVQVQQDKADQQRLIDAYKLELERAYEHLSKAQTVT